MASVVVRAAGQATVTKHRKVTIKAGTETLTVPIASPEVTHSELTADWQQIPRPGQRPLLRRGSDRLRQMAFDVTFHDGGRSVEKGLQLIRRFTTLKGPLAVSYGPQDSGSWQLTDMQIRSVMREYGTSNITHAVVSLTFVEAFPDGYTLPTAAKPAPKKAGPAKSTGSKPASGSKTTSKATPKTYTVRSGDTLSRIAAKMYGNANRWPEIAKASKLKNPNRITPGQKLVIP